MNRIISDEVLYKAIDKLQYLPLEETYEIIQQLKVLPVLSVTNALGAGYTVQYCPKCDEENNPFHDLATHQPPSGQVGNVERLYQLGMSFAASSDSGMHYKGLKVIVDELNALRTQPQAQENTK